MRILLYDSLFGLFPCELFTARNSPGTVNNDGAAVRVELHLEGDEGGVDLELLRPRGLALGVRPRSQLTEGGGGVSFGVSFGVSYTPEKKSNITVVA